MLRQYFLALQRLRPRLEQIRYIVLAHVLLYVRIVGKVVVRPQVLLQEPCDPDGQIRARKLLKPGRLIDLGATRPVTKAKLFLKGTLVGHRGHQLEEPFGVGHHFFTHCNCVESALIVGQANLAEEFVVSRAQRLWIGNN